MKVNSREILLWHGLQAGNEKDLHALYVIYYNDLLRYGLYLTSDHELSKEYINLVFLSLWNSRHKLAEVQNPRAYIITCYKNKIVFRKKKAGDLTIVYQDTKADSQAETTSSCEETLIELQEYEELKKKLNRVLSSLTERQRQLIVLRFIEEMTYEEIAERLHLSVRTVYNSIHESLKFLRTQTSKRDFVLHYFLSIL